MNQIILPVNSKIYLFRNTIFNISHFKNVHLNILVHKQSQEFVNNIIKILSFFPNLNNTLYVDSSSENLSELINNYVNKHNIKNFFRLDNGDICHPRRFLLTISNKPISFSNSILCYEKKKLRILKFKSIYYQLFKNQIAHSSNYFSSFENYDIRFKLAQDYDYYLKFLFNNKYSFNKEILHFKILSSDGNTMTKGYLSSFFSLKAKLKFIYDKNNDILNRLLFILTTPLDLLKVILKYAIRFFKR